MLPPEIAYISFDTVPAPKGAATHIEAFTFALAQHYDRVNLVTVSPTADQQQWGDRWPGVYQVALPAIGRTLVDRVMDFRQRLWQWCQGRYFDVIHIRSVFEGLPIALNKAQVCRHLILEVNGLPSIELKYRYPQVADDRELMHKLRSQEQICLDAADAVITPSPVTRDYLIQAYRVSPSRITVIPNGVDIETIRYQPPSLAQTLNPFRLLYFGTLSAWQGVAIALDAVGLYRREAAAQLTIIGPGRADQIAHLHRLATKLEIGDGVQILEPMPQTDLVTYMHQADAIAAPLTANDRNLIQGCCPLKVLEGMASGTPVITSDLPVVTALGQSETHFLAVHPGSAKAIKDAMLRLQQSPDLRQRLSITARRQIEQTYTWTQAGQSLLNLYQTGVGVGRPTGFK